MSFVASFALALFAVSQMPILPPPPGYPGATKKETLAEKRAEPIPLPKNVFPKDNEKLAIALASLPVTERDNHIAVSKETVDYFIARPYLSARMMEELFAGPLKLLKDEETGEWELIMKTGGSYTFWKLLKVKKIYIAIFNYYYKVDAGIGLKFSGTGAFILRTRKGDDDTSIIDYDIYITAGNLPLDKGAGVFSMHREWIRGDMISVIASFTALSEAASEDAQEVADEMVDEDEIFTKGEIEYFKKAFKVR